MSSGKAGIKHQAPINTIARPAPANLCHTRAPCCAEGKGQQQLQARPAQLQEAAGRRPWRSRMGQGCVGRGWRAQAPRLAVLRLGFAVLRCAAA